MSEDIIQHNEGPYYSLTVKLSAKGEVYGEYTVKGHSIEDLSDRQTETQQLLNAVIAQQSVKRW